MAVPQEVKYELPCDPAVLLGIYIPEKWKHLVTQERMYDCLCGTSHHGGRGETASMSMKSHAM